jgi:hypothetical protein
MSEHQYISAKSVTQQPLTTYQRANSFTYVANAQSTDVMAKMA